MTRVTNVFPVIPTKLIVEFDNGREYRVVNIRRYLSLPVFAPLRQPDFFRKAAFDPVAGTAVWPGEIDIAPETLYEDGVPLVLSESEKASLAV